MRPTLRSIPLRGILFSATAAILLPVFCAGAAAQPPAVIETLTYAQLNRIITRDGGLSLLAFMAAWCGPCKEELPTLNRLYHRFNSRGVRFMGISVDAGGPAAMKRVLQKRRVDFSVFWVGETAVDELNIVGIPMILLVKDGRIVEKIPGKCSYEFLEGRILEFIQ